MKDMVRKSNLLINSVSEYKYSVNELKLIAVLIEQVKITDTYFEKKQINLRNISFLEENYTNHTYLNNLCKEILKKPFKIPNTKTWVNWFSELTCENGVITYRFTPSLKSHLLNLNKNFTKYHIKNIMPLKSSYSVHIFELVKQMEKNVFRTIRIDDFRAVLNIPDSYKMNDIKRVIEKSQKELNEKCRFKFKPHYEKTGRKITHIKFEFYWHLNS